jgi:multidrug efflux system membrane fusion protein
MATQTFPSRNQIPAAETIQRPRMRLLLIAVAICAAAFFLVREFRPKPLVPVVPAIPVTTVTAREGTLPIYLSTLGSVGAWNTVTIHSLVDGEILKIDFTEGQHVQAGDLLVEIDPRAFQVGLEQAEGTLAHDRALLDDAAKDLVRYKNAGDSVTTQQTDTQKATVDQYAGMVQSDQGAVENYQLQLSYCRIVAPVSGRIGLRSVDAGNLIHAADLNGICVITQDQPIAVLFSIPENSLPAVRRALAAGTPSVVEAYDSDSNQLVATGTVMALDNQIDATTGTVRLKASFANEDRALFPNEFVNVRLLLEVLPHVTLIPLSAAQINVNTSFVFVVQSNGTVEQRSVTLGDPQDDTVPVKKGLSPGEVVVTDDLDQLQNGMAVIPAKPVAIVAPTNAAHAGHAARSATAAP